MNFARILLGPLERFLRIEAASGIVLLVAAAVALLWANSYWADSYHSLWHWSMAGVSLHFAVNDGLMAIFFLVVGLEIRRELHEGALSRLELALLPVAAATGGVVIPALLYLAIATDPAIRSGWAVPTATDIAFAVGVLALLGKRVPAELRVLLLALAIIDDVVGILIIAIAYSKGIAISGLLLAGAGIALVLAMQRFGIRSAWLYIVPGAVLWMGLHEAGIHPALSGVILGLLTPVKTENDAPSPLAQLEHTLHPWAAYAIMPIFALANAGVSIDAQQLQSPQSMSVVFGVIAGLVLGKPLGILLVTALAVRAGLCALPQGVTWRGVAVVGFLGGIGFTMAIFIGNLAFADEALLAAAKIAILIASLIAAIAGLIAGKAFLRPA